MLVFSTKIYSSVFQLATSTHAIMSVHQCQELGNGNNCENESSQVEIGKSVCTLSRNCYVFLTSLDFVETWEPRGNIVDYYQIWKLFTLIKWDVNYCAVKIANLVQFGPCRCFSTANNYELRQKGPVLISGKQKLARGWSPGEEIW